MYLKYSYRHITKQNTQLIKLSNVLGSNSISATKYWLDFIFVHKHFLSFLKCCCLREDYKVWPWRTQKQPWDWSGQGNMLRDAMCYFQIGTLRATHVVMPFSFSSFTSSFHAEVAPSEWNPQWRRYGMDNS